MCKSDMGGGGTPTFRVAPLIRPRFLFLCLFLTAAVVLVVAVFMNDAELAGFGAMYGGIVFLGGLEGENWAWLKGGRAVVFVFVFVFPRGFRQPSHL